MMAETPREIALVGRTIRERACRWSNGCQGFKDGKKHLSWCNELTTEFTAAVEAEREACAVEAAYHQWGKQAAAAIRARISDDS